MARLDALPSIDIIRGFKGILDFYIWRGLPCVRAWPKYRPARQTDASKAAALLFGAVIKAFSLTHSTVLEQLQVEATGIPRTPRDIYVSGVYGNLHEASMSDFLTLLTQCRDFLSNLQAVLTALDSIDTDELVVNVDESVLPAGAATAAKQLPDGHNVTVDNPSIPVTGTFWQPTQPISAAALPLPTGASIAANQATMITALQKIDDLQNALQSKALDRLIVRGDDQVVSIKSRLAPRVNGALSGADGFIDSSTPPAGEYWHITYIAVADTTSPTTGMRVQMQIPGAIQDIREEIAARAADECFGFPCELWLANPDAIRAYFAGGQAGDTVRIGLFGHRMTVET